MKLMFPPAFRRRARLILNASTKKYVLAVFLLFVLQCFAVKDYHTSNPLILQNAHAQNESDYSTYSNETVGIEFKYPDQMEKIDSRYQEVVVALVRGSTKGGDRFPTFNVTVNPGTAPSDTLSKFEQALLQEYRSIGFSDVEVLRSFETPIPGAEGKGFILNITYSSRGIPFQGLVAMVPAIDKYFVLTYLDRAESYERYAAWRRLLFKSFQITTYSDAESEPRAMFGGGGLATSEQTLRESQDEAAPLKRQARPLEGPENTSAAYGLIGVVIAAAAFFGMRRTG